MLQRLRALQGWLLLWIRALLNESLHFNMKNRLIWKGFFWNKLLGSEARRLILVFIFTHLAVQPGGGWYLPHLRHMKPMLRPQPACNLPNGLFPPT